MSCQAERVILALPCHHCLSGRCGGSLSTLAPRVNGRPQCVSPASSFRQRSYWRPSPPSPPSSDQFAASSTIPSIVRWKMPWSCCARKRQHGPPAPIPMRPASSFSTASPLANTRSQWLLPVSIKLCRTFELVRDHNPFCILCHPRSAPHPRWTPNQLAHRRRTGSQHQYRLQPRPAIRSQGHRLSRGRSRKLRRRVRRSHLWRLQRCAPNGF